MSKRNKGITRVLLYVFLILILVFSVNYMMSHMEGMKNRKKKRNQSGELTPQSEKNRLYLSKLNSLSRENTILKKKVNSMNKRIRMQSKKIRDQNFKMQSMVGPSK